jgi:4-amino-4-deoxy-L-arabinose transferase-like glycosyltransferase
MSVPAVAGRRLAGPLPRDIGLHVARALTSVPLALTGILVLGAALRLPNLQNIPKLTDEMRDAIFSLPIYRGESLPLANFSAYDGALFNYLLAVLFWLVGPELQAPRLMMLVLGIAGLPLAYLMARERYGRSAALLAAALLALNPVHVLVNSRVAWGNCLTPLFTTAAFWLIYRATQMRRVGELSGQSRSSSRGWELVPAGLLFGLALQTHPTTAALLPAAMLAVVWSRPRLLRGPWPWLACLAFGLGYANMLLFNLRSGFESITFAQKTRADYTGATAGFAHDYLTNQGILLLGLYRAFGGAVEDRDFGPAFLLDPLLVIAAGIGLVALIWAARVGDLLPLASLVSVAAMLPLVNDRFEPILDGRYVAPLLPLCFAAVGGLAFAVLRAVRKRRPLLRRAGLSGLALALVLIAGLQALGLQRYLAQNAAAVLRSARLWNAYRVVERAASGSDILLDKDLERVVFGAGSSELLTFEYLCTMRGLPCLTERITPGGLLRTIASDPQKGARLIVMERAKRKLLDPRLQVRQLDPEEVERGVQPYAYGVYLVRWDPRL